MTGQEVAQRTAQQELAEQIRDERVRGQIEAVLPENVPFDRFARVTQLALIENPDLVAADRTSFFSAVVKCAADGLVPDGRQAALVIYKGKVSYQPMIGGLADLVAEFGWMLTTATVHENDEFEYDLGEQKVTHRPPRLGTDRGARIGAYAVAVHRDGTRKIEVLDAADVAKCKAKARTDKIWNEWPDAMWRKTAGKKLAKQLPRSERESERIRRILDENGGLINPVDQLYGPSAPALSSGETEDGRTTDSTAPVKQGPDGSPQNGLQQAEENVGTDGGETGPQAASTPTLPLDGEGAGGSGSPQEEFDWSSLADKAETETRADGAGEAEIPGGEFHGQKIKDVGRSKKGRDFLLWTLQNVSPGDTTRAAVEQYVRTKLPGVWAEFVEARQDAA